MAYATTDTNSLRDAILKMWTPFVGAKSYDEVMEGNVNKMITHDYGQSSFGRAVLLDNLPLRPIFPFLEDLSDNKPPFEIEKETLAGSWSEGLQFYGLSNLKLPDMDYMLVLKNIFFSQEDQLSGKLTLKDDTPFVHAYITDEDAIKLWEDFLADQNDERGKRLSSKKLKERLNENYNKFFPCFQNNDSNNINDGAAININCNNPVLKSMHNVFNKGNLSDMEFAKDMLSINDFSRDFLAFTGWDIVLAISCEGWPSCAKEWTTRPRKWPHAELLHKITHDGFHIVPKKSSEGDFRLSFSFAETALIENLTELQHKVLRSFKAVVKFYQNSWSPRIKEIITTYHLKTIAFWHFERLTQDSITEQTVVTHLILLLQELAEALRARELPMYFMPMVNLFENVENPEDAFDIGETVEKLSHDLPRLTMGIKNITSCFQRQTSHVKNLKEKLSNFKDSLHRKGNAVPDPSKRRMQKESSFFDTMQELGKYLNPMSNIHFPPQRQQQTVSGHEERTAIPSVITALLQPFQNGKIN